MTTDIEHPVVWTDEKIARFWDYQSRSVIASTRYFTFMLGDALVSFVLHRLPLNGRICDFGAGKGDLTRHLLDMTPGEIHAVEFSPRSAQAVSCRFAEAPRYRGCTLVQQGRTGFPDGFFDHAFLCETIEHMSDDHLSGTLTELARIVRPGGHLIVSTPFNEDLAESTVFCPDCGCVFHRWQHLRSFTTSSLETTIAPFGFETVECRNDNLWEWKGMPWRSRLRVTLLKALRGWSTPNLIYLGRRAASV
ncbi:MAG: class I SAM-dependent methyltransferase [Thermoanaerobaculaceae bacterium]|jgi:ubiquinone/menaquinone biosynthesis C-methylase UbiE|nr:class I SAM-dependent methyltransferase [Thermoanaerobaculaceae bacterium]